MRTLEKRKWIVILFLLFAATLLSAFGLSMRTQAYADESGYDGAYRNQLVYSAKSGWNNDPNGLLYVNSVWHMYYQYSYNPESKETVNRWADIGWGHATSTDLVHWEEQPVAIPAYQTVDGNYYAMMFSGSAVYDEYNTSGLFETDEDGTVRDGQGIVAVLTQPLDEAGGQRQILAYSKDGGESFTIYGEIIGAREDGGIGDGEFRDPKVFWNDELNEWLMVVGGGSVRMYASSNLLEWEFLGETGYWGECPDLSRYETEEGTKYVLILSPEDKEKSHEYNGTSRKDTYYPAEYYVVGELDENGLFVGETELRRLSEGIDSYAFQSFNNAPDGKVYGVSWAASWKTVGAYESFRSAYNGGMTLVTEIGLLKENGDWTLTRTPVSGYTQLRGEALETVDGVLSAGDEALSGVHATVADLELELDFTKGASEATLLLRASSYERILLHYDAESEVLTLDRSQSSLLAKDTSLYCVAYRANVSLTEGKLSLRILLDRAFISVFANGGRASFFSAVFPAASSDGMKLTANGDLGVTAAVYPLNGIFTAGTGEIILSTSKIDTTVGSENTIVVSSFDGNFVASDVRFTLAEGEGVVSLEAADNAVMVSALAAGYAKVEAAYGSYVRYVDIYVYEDGFTSDLGFTTAWGGFSYVGSDGYHLASGTEDAFRFSTTSGENFLYSARFSPMGNSAQAAALVFGTSDNLTDYLVVTADWRDGLVKLWRAGTGDIAVVGYPFEAGRAYTLTAIILQGTLRVYVDGTDKAVLVCELDGYQGGLLGLNVYNSEMVINDVRFIDFDGASGDYALYLGEETLVYGVLNVTDANALLADGEYSFQNGVLAISESYLLTLVGKTDYEFKILSSIGTLYYGISTKFSSVSVSPVNAEGYFGEDLQLSLGRDTVVNRVLVGGREVAFTQSERTVTVAAEELNGLRSGALFVTVYTSNGRAETVVSITEKDLSAVNYSKTASIASICGAAVIVIVGAACYLILTKKKKSGNS